MYVCVLVMQRCIDATHMPYACGNPPETGPESSATSAARHGRHNPGNVPGVNGDGGGPFGADGF